MKQSEETRSQSHRREEETKEELILHRLPQEEVAQGHQAREKKDEMKRNLSGATATVLLDDGREVEIPVEYLNWCQEQWMRGCQQLPHQLNRQMNQK